MAPDFEYFFKFKVNSNYSHTIGGLFYFDLPVTYLLTWIFISIVRHNLMANLPIFLQAKVQPIWKINAKKLLVDKWAVFVLSALLGSASHIFWDAFTHNNTLFTSNLPIYDGTYIPYEGVKYPLWYALQHISTAVGLFIVILYILFQKKGEITQLHSPKILYWLLVVGVTMISVYIRFLIYPDDMQEGNFVVSTISGFCLAVIVAGFINFNNLILEPDRHG